MRILSLCLIMPLFGCGKKDLGNAPDLPATAGTTGATAGSGKKDLGNAPDSPVGAKAVADNLKLKPILQQLGIAYHLYEHQNDRGPKSPTDLLPYLENQRKLIEPVESGAVVLFMEVAVTRLQTPTDMTVLGYEATVPKQGGLVMYADGRVASLTAAEFATAILAKK